MEETESMVKSIEFERVSGLRKDIQYHMTSYSSNLAYYLMRPNSLLHQGHLVMFQTATLQGQTGLELYN